MDQQHDNQATVASPAAVAVRRPPRVALAAAGLGWVAVIAFGMGRLISYGATPGVAATAAPSGDALVAAGRPSVVMFLHPFCPCSGASVEALAKLVEQRPDAAIATVFSDVRDDDRGTADGELWRRVGELKGVRRIVDRDGAIAQRFDAHTSGQAFVYAADGASGFRGGLTAGRGQIGDSVGLQAARAVVDGRAPTTRAADVFGCELD